ncbi:MAG TPA: T9SS type A sorting domain-containing protein, partial [Ohtaekwangia sp.]|nr:T9SS type A sorting domain-containing protein [Ohtaekwangia sp.]
SPTYNPGSIAQTTYYRVMVTSTINGAVCSAYSNCVTVINNTKTWNGSANSNWNNASNWTPSGVPTSANCVVIPNVTTDPLIIGSDYVGYAYNLTVLPGGRLDINPTNTLWVTNTINVNPGGNLFVTNNASLLQTDDVANTGTFVVTRITQPMYKFDFTYWGSPLVMGSFTLGNLSPNTLADKYFSWNPTNSGGGGSWIQESAATVMDPTKGYIVRAPQNFSSNPAITQTYTATFIGNVNNGDISIPISIGSLGPGTSDDKMNLIGNPYPSAVDADLFLNDPVNSSLIDGTIYFWTHHAPPSASFPSPFYGTFVYNYSPSGYASYNSLGGTNTVPLGYGGPTPDGKIATGQGFFVKGLASGTARFRNDMRIVGNNSTFFRMGHQKHRIWLNLANTQGAFSQALVGYADGATDGLDRSFDGVAMASNTVSLYSLADDVKLGIQGFALPFEIEDLIPMGYSSTTAGSYTIGIDHVDGVFTNQKVYLEDKLLNTIHDLTVEPYEFATEAGTFDTRFVLRFTDGMLSTPDVDSVKIIAFVSESMFYLQSDNHVKDIKIYDMTGKLITEYRPETVGLFTSEFNFAEGIYIAKIEFHDRQRSSVKLKN